MDLTASLKRDWNSTPLTDPGMRAVRSPRSHAAGAGNLGAVASGSPSFGLPNWQRCVLNRCEFPCAGERLRSGIYGRRPDEIPVTRCIRFRRIVVSSVTYPCAKRATPGDGGCYGGLLAIRLQS
jgi:hypothetical protein